MRKAVLAVFVTLTAAVSGAADLRGRVLDSGTRAPVAGARVTVAGGGETTADADGAFTVAVGDVRPVTVVASHPDYRPQRVDLAALPRAPLEILLEPRVSFTDRVEVTASRAREGVDPASFTNIPKEQVEAAYWAQDPAMLLSTLVPGLYAYNDNGNGIGYSYFTIRGFGQARSRVTINGAPLNDAESGELFFIDLADFLSTAGDVQVRRGVFGLSGIGGAIDLTTADPPMEPGFTLETGAGSYGTRRVTVIADSGLFAGRWALTARYSRIRTDGYRDQSWVNMWNAFLSLTRLGDRSRLRVNLFGGPEETHLAYYGVPRSVLDGGLTGDSERDRRFNPLTWPGEIDHFVQPHLQVIHELAVSPGVDLEQTFFAFHGDGYYDQYKTDRRLEEYNLPEVEGPGGTVVERSDLIRRRSVAEWDAGWLPTLTATRGAWTFTTSGELRLHRGHHEGQVRWAESLPVAVPAHHRYYDYRVDKTTGTAAFDASWKATRRLTLSGGLALTRHRYEMLDDRISGVSFSETYDFALPRLGAVVALSGDADVFLAVARGAREPSFRTLYDPQDYWSERAHLRAEDVWDWEAGVSIRRPRWRLRTNLFLMDFANEIVWAGSLDDSGVPVYGNGARSRHQGLELDASWTPEPRLAVDGSLTWSHNTFTRYREYGWDGGVAVYDGNRIAGYPDLLATLTARTRLGAVRLGATAVHTGRFYLDNTEDNRRHPALRDAPGYVPRVNPAFTTVDLTARIELPELPALALASAELELRVNNALDETYTAFGYVDGEPYFIPAAGRNAYVGLTLRR